jgi:HSP20 family protein
MTESKMTKPRETQAGLPAERGGLLRPFEEMERLVESIFPHGLLRPTQWEWPSWEKTRPFFAHRMPAADVIDRENEVLVRAEVPGVKKEDLTVSVADDSLTIRGCTECQEETKREDYYRHEMSYGEFSRTLALPQNVDTSRAVAKMKDGVIEITLPKLERAKRRSLDIKIE